MTGVSIVSGQVRVETVVERFEFDRLVIYAGHQSDRAGLQATTETL